MQQETTGPDQSRGGDQFLFLAVGLFVLGLLGLGTFYFIAGRERVQHQVESDHRTAIFAPEKFPFQLLELPGFETGFEHPRAFAFDESGHLLVAGDQAVRIFSATGDFLSTFSLPEKPVAVAVCGGEKILVAFSGKLFCYDTTGQCQGDFFGEKSCRRPEKILSLAGDRENLFIADGAAKVILHYDAAGNFLNTLGENASGKGAGFRLPSPGLGLAMGPDKTLFVAHRGLFQVEQYSGTGERLSLFGQSGPDAEPAAFCGCCNPASLAVLSDGRVATMEKGLPRLKVWDATGKLLAALSERAFPVARADQEIQLLQGPGETIYALNPPEKRIRIFRMVKRSSE